MISFILIVIVCLCGAALSARILAIKRQQKRIASSRINLAYSEQHLRLLNGEENNGQIELMGKGVLAPERILALCTDADRRMNELMIQQPSIQWIIGICEKRLLAEFRYAQQVVCIAFTDKPTYEQVEALKYYFPDWYVRQTIATTSEGRFPAIELSRRKRRFGERLRLLLRV